MPRSARQGNLPTANRSKSGATWIASTARPAPVASGIPPPRPPPDRFPSSEFVIGTHANPLPRGVSRHTFATGIGRECGAFVGLVDEYDTSCAHRIAHHGFHHRLAG